MRLGIKIYIFFILTISIGIIFFLRNPQMFAQETPTSTPPPNQDQQRLNDLQGQIGDLEKKIADAQAQEKSLSLEISVMDNQIKLTQLRIDATKQEILVLGGDIDKANKKILQLEKALEDLIKVLVNRIISTYQVGKTQNITMLISASNISDFFTRASYLRIVQAHDKKIIYDTQQAKNDYVNQKDIYEGKKKEVEKLKAQLESYTAQLDQEKKAKQALLEVTKNDEKRYQDLLAQARAEFEAIQGIVSGKGVETVTKEVSEGETIATVINGSSCNSSGGHLHFIVSRNGATENPFSYLKSVDYENCSGSSCGNSDGDPFNPSGGWNWPLNPKIRMNQGYGATWATIHDPFIRQIYSFHNGLDIVGSSQDVKAVQAGTLYQGSYTVGGGCRLRYVRVDHKDSDLDTFYLHINYVF